MSLKFKTRMRVKHVYKTAISNPFQYDSVMNSIASFFNVDMKLYKTLNV